MSPSSCSLVDVGVLLTLYISFKSLSRLYVEVKSAICSRWGPRPPPPNRAYELILTLPTLQTGRMDDDEVPQCVYADVRS